MKFVKIIGTIVLAIIVLVCSLSIYEYLSWKKVFLNDRESFVCNDFRGNIGRGNIDERIKEYVFSKDGTASISFSIEEIFVLLKNLPTKSNTLIVEEICIKPSKGVWSIYLKSKMYGINMLWTHFNLVKDARETAQLYVKEFSFGGVSLFNIFSSKVMEGINEGISNAIILVNENGFLGRDIHNIELLEDSVVVR